MTEQSPTTISRRTLAKGAAWTLPAVTLAGQAPALSASAIDCSQISIGATCSTLSLLNSSVTFTITAPAGTVIPAGTTLQYNSAGGGVVGGYTYGGTLPSLSTSTTSGSGTTIAKTFTTTADTQVLTFTVKPNTTLLTLGIIKFTMCLTGVAGSACAGACASRTLEFKTVLGVGVSICA